MALKIDQDDTTNDVIHGCLASWLCMVAGTFLIFFVLTKLAPDPSADVQNAIQLVLWLFGIAIGGFVAARRSRNDSYKAPLYVGLLATFFVAARLPHQDHGAATDALVAVLKNPPANWRHIVGLTLTVPAALLGGLIAHLHGSRAQEDTMP
jgi:hypothetical protein